MFNRNKHNHKKGKPLGPYNLFAHFIGPNPPTSFNTISSFPCINPTAFIGPFSSVIGDVSIGENVFVAPNVSIRADEGTPFHIGSNTNIQDGVILHGLKNGRVIVDKKRFSMIPRKKLTHLPLYQQTKRNSPKRYSMLTQNFLPHMLFHLGHHAVVVE